MKLALVLVICLSELCYSSSLGGIIETFNAGADCTLLKGSRNNVICISKTQFVLSYQSPTLDTPLECPTGTVCANVAAICSAVDPPVCLNDVPGAKGVCGVCSPLWTSPVCISKTQYAFCNNGKIVPSMTYSCAAPTPNCKATLDGNKNLIGICTAATSGLDCQS